MFILIAAVLLLAAAMIVNALATYSVEPIPPDVAAFTPTVIPRPPEVVASEPSVPTTPEPAYTEDELEMLACTVFQEAGSNDCSDDMQLAVANVVLNRLASPDWPDTLEEVLTQYRQWGEFYWTGVVWSESAEFYPEAVERAYENARRALEGERFVPEDVVWCAEFVQGEIVYEENGVYFCR